jgi:hypothetical protein
LRLQTEASLAGARFSAVRLRAGTGSDIAVALPDGWVVGTSLDGQRWGHHVTAADGWRLALAALDLDGDAQELIIASGKTVSAWTRNARHAHTRDRSTAYGDRPLSIRQRPGAAAVLSA